MSNRAKCLAVLAVLCSFCALGVAPALGAGAYESTGTSLVQQGTEPGAFQVPGRAAVQQSTGNLFVVGSGNDRVEVFAPGSSGDLGFLTEFGGGELDAPWGIAIDEDAGQTYVYVADAGNEEIVKYDVGAGAVPSFSVDPGFSSPAAGGDVEQVGSFHAALAIDPTTHDLLVADPANKRIERFDAEGGFISSFDGSAGAGSPGAFSGPIDLAVNSTGDVYVIDATGNIVMAEGTSQALRYSGAGEYKATLPDVGTHHRVATVAVNPETDEVLVSGDQDNVYEAGPPPYVPLLGLFGTDNQLLEMPEVSPTTGLYDTVAGIAFAPGQLPHPRLYGVFDQGNYFGTLYGSPQIQRFDQFFRPEIAIGAVTSIEGEATLTGTVNPNTRSTDYRFEYTIAADDNWHSTPTESAGAGSEPVDVSADVVGLRGVTEYKVRLVATNADGTKTSSEEAFTTGNGSPVAATNGATAVTPEAAFLRGTASPNGPVTRYRFEWGASSGYGNVVPLSGESLAGGGGIPHVFSVRVTGLTPATTYHYRIVATNSLGTSTGEDAIFTTEAAGLARYGYEMVSPPDKAGGAVTVAPLGAGGGVISPDGNSAMYTANTAFAGQQGDALTNSYRATRATPQWQTVPATPPVASSLVLSGPAQARVRMVSRDQTRIVVETKFDPVSKERAPRINYYAQELPNGKYVQLTPDAESGSQSYESSLVGQTRDLRYVLIRTSAQLLPSSNPGAQAIYLVDTATGNLTLVSVVGNGAGTPVELTNGLDSSFVNNDNVLSSGARRVFFTASVGGEEQLYVRDLESEETTALPGRWMDATPDGRYVFVSTGEQLVPSDPSSGIDVYRLDLDAGPGFDPVLISADDEPGDGIGGGVSGSVGTAEDGSAIFFTMSEQQLIAGGPLAPGKAKLYYWDEDGLKFVSAFEAQIAGSPEDEFTSSTSTARAQQGDVSPNGHVMIAITGADLSGERPVTGTTGQQMFFYDADESAPLEPDTTCISCLPSPNKTPLFNSAGKIMKPRFAEAELFAGYPLQNNQYVTNAGQAFFQTEVPLVPGDVNGFVSDVYTYMDGRPRLISTGRSPVGSYLLGATPDGSSILFATAERLSGWDVDGVLDAYVARIGGGLPDPPTSPAPCEGDACLRPVVPPLDPTPASSAFSGPGNVRPEKPAAKCPKGKAKSAKGKACVKKPKKHGQSANKKGHGKQKHPRKHGRRAGR